jgi:glycosyltransferase involved in cell wall biosynthesis
MLITVFTPTYNRAHLLPRVYESLCKQTFRDFEWVIVDDGSVDDTKSLSLTLIPEQSSPTRSLSRREGTFFPIRYFRQENGGKHRAINRGVKEAQGELFFIVDSDDMLPPDALEIVAKAYEGIRDDCSFAGVCGLDGTFEGKVIGSGLPAEVIDDTSIAVRFKYGVTGDMKEVFRTSVLREFPFPEIDGERFCPEMLVWNRIATRYKLRYFNRVIYWAEYQADGLTAGIVKVRMNSPVATMMTYAEMTEYPVPFKVKVKAAINYWRFRCCVAPSQPPPVWEASVPKLKWWWNWVMPVGKFMHILDVHKGKR